MKPEGSIVFDIVNTLSMIFQRNDKGELVLIEKHFEKDDFDMSKVSLKPKEDTYE
jgi:hypothetical protein